MTKTYRDNGAVGALLDEYERAIQEMQALIGKVSKDQLVYLADPDTEDSDCRSIQTILTHVVRAGYCYVIEIRRHLGEDLAYVNRETLDSTVAYEAALTQMFAYNEHLFHDYPNLTLEEKDPSKKIVVAWGQYYNRVVLQ